MRSSDHLGGNGLAQPSNSKKNVLTEVWQAPLRLCKWEWVRSAIQQQKEYSDGSTLISLQCKRGLPVVPHMVPHKTHENIRHDSKPIRHAL